MREPIYGKVLLKNKANRAMYLDVYTSNGIDNLKALLSNGYVVSFGTDSGYNLGNWITKTGIANSKSEKNMLLCKRSK